MDYAILAAELAEPGYAWMSDQEAADALNAATVQAVRSVPIAELASLAYGLGLPARLWGVIYSTEAPAELKAVAQSLLGLMSAPFAEIDLVTPGNGPDPAAQAMLDGLENALLLSAAERAAIEALAGTTTSRAAQLGLGSLTAGDVQRARGGRW